MAQKNSAAAFVIFQKSLAVMLWTSVARYNPAMTQSSKPRRSFLRGALAAGGLGAAQIGRAQDRGSADFDFLPKYARAQNYKSLKQSSFDRTGGNRDSWNIPAGGVQEVFNATGPA